MTMAAVLNRNAPRFAPFRLSPSATILLDLHDPNYRALYFLEFYEPEVQRAIEMCLRPGDAFIDCGANIGLYSCLAAGIVGGEGFVISFEPLAEVAAITQVNIDVNRFAHVALRRVAVSDVGGTAHLHRPADAPHGHTSLGGDPSAAQEVSPCTLVRLDDAVPRDVWDRVRLIKLDVEGAELSALRGAVGLLRHSRADVIVEINPVTADRAGYQTIAIFDLLASLGYAPFVWSDESWMPATSRRDDLTANVLFRQA